ncbi:MBL fold metallo-hydrolase [Aspergillus chevalieri]|uniref:Metallo-beta-lactamase domain-containing protein n=1 Tax=Aspergillus chevalieri TaxID=182096 RepID=A0A7R7VTP3_ASPCH|nr:uncharacterized protein ACHE_60457S [Aspergillus chevalieri]BCR90571.1 hypothetical protein ACHE_60457S [Aspergillus chevalieri]
MSQLHIPPSNSTVQVSIIDTTFDSNLPTAHFMGPTITGFENFQLVAYAFLVTHKDHTTGKERRIVFDLGCPKDPDNDFPPSTAQLIKGLGGYVKASKDVSETLTEHGVGLGSIEAVIWSHAHFDHVGHPSLFPKSTSLLVGPGVKTSYFPGYPANKASPVLACEFEGREVRELDFSTSDLEIGTLKAIDYFGDRSFYLISAPGHAVGHVNALARTTSDSFIHFAGDSFHHASELRPHGGHGASLPLSMKIPGFGCPCSGSTFHAIHPLNHSRIPEHYQRYYDQVPNDPNKVPFHTLSETESGETMAVDLAVARDTIKAVQSFDSDPRVFVIAAHDMSLYGVLEYFPESANDWRERGWKEEGYWLFLRDFGRAVEVAGRD